MVVATGEQRGTGTRAERGRVEVGVAETGFRQAVDGRRRDVRPVAAQLREADVVEDDQHEVGRPLGCACGRWPPRRGLVVKPTADPAELVRLHAAPTSRRSRPRLGY